MTGDFNQWLRDLVSDAVSVTPPPPELDGRSPRPTERRPWLVWAMAGAAAVLVIGIVAAFALTSGDDEQVVTANETDTTVATVAAPVSTIGTSSTSTAPTATTSGSTTTVAPSTTVAPAVPPTVPTFQPEPVPSVVTAGDDGVWVTAGTERVQWVDEPMSRAVLVADGVIVQRRTGYAQEWSGEDTALFKVTSPGGELQPFLDDLDLGDTPWIELHDAAVVEGELRTVLTLLPEIESLESPPGRLVVSSPDGSFDVLDDAFGGWESGSSRLSMSRTGLIVGEFSAEVFRGYVGYSIGDTPAPTRAELGLPADDFQDCGDCPRLYTVSDDGTTIAWLAANVLFRYDVETDRLRTGIKLGEGALDAASLDVTDGAAAVGPYVPGGGPAELMVWSSGAMERTLLSAPSASFGPSAFTTSWGTPDPDPVGVGMTLGGADFSDDEHIALLLGVLAYEVTGSATECEGAGPTVTRLDGDVIRIRSRCDDSVGGVDYRIHEVRNDGDRLEALVERRSLCLRGVSDGLCV